MSAAPVPRAAELTRPHPPAPARIALALALLALAACAGERRPVPLDSPAERHAAPVPPPPDPAPAAAPRQTTLIEEELPADPALPDAAAGAAGGAAGDIAPAEPSVLSTITPATAPNVAAATRLTDTARQQMAAGNYPAALEQLERAIAVDPSNVYAYYFLAELHLRHQTYDQAIAFADRAAALARGAAPDWSSRAFTLQGNAFEAAGRFADARAAYERALAVAPNNLAARSGLARLSGAPAAP
jgi:tetratricopeptide (TPR) repeat protein